MTNRKQILKFDTLEDARNHALETQSPVQLEGSEIIEVIGTDKMQGFVALNGLSDRLRKLPASILRGVGIQKVLSVHDAMGWADRREHTEARQAAHAYRLASFSHCRKCGAQVDGNHAAQVPGTFKFRNKMSPCVFFECDECDTIADALQD